MPWTRSIRRRRVSPDERSVAEVLKRAAWRARGVAIAEAAAWGAAVATISVIAGVVTAVAFAVWRLRGTTEQSIVQAVERAHAGVRNLL